MIGVLKDVIIYYIYIQFSFIIYSQTNGLYRTNDCSRHIEIDYAMAYCSYHIHQYEDRISLGTFSIRKTGHSSLTSDTKAAYDPRIASRERELCIYIYYVYRKLWIDRTVDNYNERKFTYVYVLSPLCITAFLFIFFSYSNRFDIYITEI